MKIRKLEEEYNNCVTSGFIEEMEEDNPERAKTLLENVERDMESLKSITLILEDEGNYGLLWCNYYEIVRQLITGILLLEKVKSNNHKCLFAYICIQHKEWEIDWEVLETMRLLRNSIRYQGMNIPEKTWKEYKIKFRIYTEIFSRMLKEQVKSI